MRRRRCNTRARRPTGRPARYCTLRRRPGDADRTAAAALVAQLLDLGEQFVAPALPDRQLVEIDVEALRLGERAEQVAVGMGGQEPVARDAVGQGRQPLVIDERNLT